jgi:phage terminase small subunit
MGRHRIPTKTKLLRGTFNVTDDGDRDDQYFPCMDTTSIIEAPAYMSEKSKAAWLTITQPLIAVGALHELDLPLLEEGFRLSEELEMLNQEIASLMSKKKKKEEDYRRWNKLSSQRTRSLQVYIQIFSRFGVSPAERAKIQNLVQHPIGSSKEEKQENPVLAILADDD